MARNASTYPRIAYPKVLSACELFAWVTVNDCFALALIKAVPFPISAAALAVVAINKMMLSAPARKSVTTVVVALVVQVKLPVELSLPSSIPLTTWLISLGLSASVGRRRKLASAKCSTLYIDALREIPSAADVHAEAMKAPLIAMQTIAVCK